MSEINECPHCGAPYEPVRKWNSGNPKTFMLSTCSCEEDRMEGELKRRYG